MMTDTISVLLPVHDGVEPDHLARALDSIAQQTHQPEEVVIVQDGPLRRELLDILGRFANSRRNVVRVPLEVNSGAGVANQMGLCAASSVWVAKADSDDVNVPHRLESQLAFAIRNGVDVCGAAMGEFDRDEHVINAVRRNPLTHSEIARRMKLNNPVNHPTAFFRREAALAVGGYPTMRYMQDYDLFARMLAHGARFANMPDVLVHFRANAALYRRRSSRAMDSCEVLLQRNLRRYGLISTPRSWVNTVTRSVVRRLPVPALRLFYRLFLARGEDSA